jgi:hypothetical protein
MLFLRDYKLNGLYDPSKYRIIAKLLPVMSVVLLRRRKGGKENRTV